VPSWVLPLSVRWGGLVRIVIEAAIIGN